MTVDQISWDVPVMITACSVYRGTAQVIADSPEEAADIIRNGDQYEDLLYGKMIKILDESVTMRADELVRLTGE